MGSERLKALPRCGGGGRRWREEIAVAISALKVCIGSGSLDRGRMLHADAIEAGIHSHPCVASTLVSMYAKCGSVIEARRVFDGMPHRTVVSWNALIQGYEENGEEIRALDAFLEMQQGEGCSPNSQTFVAVINACTSMAAKEESRRLAGDGNFVKERALEKGMALHLEAAGRGFDLNGFVANALIQMYANCGSLEDAVRVFVEMRSRSVVSWTALMLGFVENGEEEHALELLELMLRTQCCSPDALTFVAALKACSVLAVKEDKIACDKLLKETSLARGRAIHSRATSSGCIFNIVLESTLVDMYAKCGSMADARRVFDAMKFQNVVSCNALMLGYAENGEEEVALRMLYRMQAEENCQPDAWTYVAAFKACVGLAAKEHGRKLDGLPKLVKVESLEKGMAVHAHLISSGCDADLFVTNTLVDMYARCRSMEDSQKVFDRSLQHSVVSWNALILGYAENGEGKAALDVFEGMKAAGQCEPDSLTYLAALKACNSLTVTEKDKELIDGKPVNSRSLEIKFAVHAQAGVVSDVVLSNALVDAYASSGSTVDARNVFDGMKVHTLVSWNTLMHAYADSGQAEETLQLFACLKREGCRADSRTYIALLKASGSLASTTIGSAVHGEICGRGLEQDAALLTALVDMYGKCGSMAEAQQLMDSSGNPEVLIALVAGYSRQGDVGRVLILYRQMRDEGLKITSNCFVSILTACSHSGLVNTSKKLFQAMSSQQFGIAPGMEHYVCMVDILGRANQLEEAVAMVQEMPFEANAVIWMTILGASSKWNNLRTGRLAFENLVRLDASNGAAYTLMANICKSSGTRRMLSASNLNLDLSRPPFSKWYLQHGYARSNSGHHLFL